MSEAHPGSGLPRVWLPAGQALRFLRSPSLGPQAGRCTGRGARDQAQGCYLPSCFLQVEEALRNVTLLGTKQNDSYFLLLPVKAHFSSWGKRVSERPSLASLQVDQSWPWKWLSLGSRLVVDAWPSPPTPPPGCLHEFEQHLWSFCPFLAM